MDVSTPYLSPHGGLALEVLLLQILNQLNTHHNFSMQHTVQAVQHCVLSLKQEEKRRKELISRQEEDYSKLSADYLNLENLYLAEASRIDNLTKTLEESSKKYEEIISVLERRVEKETSAKMVCERDAKLQKSLEQINKELYEMRNCSHSVGGKMNQIFSTLQLISQNQNIGKDIYILENQLSLAKETIGNSTAMIARQSKELQDERQKTQTLEEQNEQLKTSLRNLQKEQQERTQNFEAKLLVKAEELMMKVEDLKNKDNQLTDEKNKNIELLKMLDEMQKKQRDSEKENADLLEAGRMNCSRQLQHQTTALQSQLETEKKKNQEAQNQLKTCNELLDVTKEYSAVHVTKVIEFTNKYKKYLASGNLNFAISVYGDSEIKDMFRPSESIFGKQMTSEQANKNGFYCGNGRFIPTCFKCDGRDDCGNRNDELNCPSTLFPLGARVVRGKNWNWGSQDGDPPGVGTVIQVNKGDGWNRVHWDNGHNNSYRVGADGAYDLQSAAGYFCGAD